MRTAENELSLLVAPGCGAGRLGANSFRGALILAGHSTLPTLPSPVISGLLPLCCFDQVLHFHYPLYLFVCLAYSRLNTPI